MDLISLFMDRIFFVIKPSIFLIAGVLYSVELLHKAGNLIKSELDLFRVVLGAESIFCQPFCGFIQALDVTSRMIA